MLRVEGLTVHYGKARAIENVSLRVGKGEWVSMIGANGAGKSTTIKAIMGLVRPGAGKITFEDRDITGLPAHLRVGMGIGYVPEGRRVFGDLTVEENLRLGAYVQRDAAQVKRNIERMYSLFPRLAERRTQLSRTMSGGEQQMLAIGRALMSEPRLLLIDEVSMGLMPIAVQQAFQIIGDLHKQGLTILLVEQNARKALKAADRGYVIETGHVTMEGTAADLQGNERVKQAYLGI
ncbi:MAG TPA: ABC transporter ATP-binding protein [Symbiobacteriaceae bacterium]|nr:ABC transporter ATP-binding protein [Symbiobacteriaceae bacterium]